MTNDKRIVIYLLALIIITMTGCKAMIDSKVDEHGNTILLDTPKNWDLWITVMDFEIKDEAAGMRAPGGFISWGTLALFYKNFGGRLSGKLSKIHRLHY